ncbi:hypothetical protein FGO68_gene13184 [Halteria grandinella]|uniref:Uncharacterized protein n=1 Tax=Halteria grandinella TaxID=5974 RepID=A0A8J8T1M2_HALGN|nr:hypothetical protein FGO68_gene13184 [Halteria grandinella]
MYGAYRQKQTKLINEKTQNQLQAGQNSLNVDFRKKKIQQIDIENSHLLRRLNQAKPTVIKANTSLLSQLRKHTSVIRPQKLPSSLQTYVPIHQSVALRDLINEQQTALSRNNGGNITLGQLTVTPEFRQENNNNRRVHSFTTRMAQVNKMKRQLQTSLNQRGSSNENSPQKQYYNELQRRDIHIDEGDNRSFVTSRRTNSISNLYQDIKQTLSGNALKQYPPAPLNDSPLSQHYKPLFQQQSPLQLEVPKSLLLPSIFKQNNNSGIMSGSKNNEQFQSYQQISRQQQLLTHRKDPSDYVFERLRHMQFDDSTRIQSGIQNIDNVSYFSYLNQH